MLLAVVVSGNIMILFFYNEVKIDWRLFSFKPKLENEHPVAVDV